jgi:hypothetical protein
MTWLIWLGAAYYYGTLFTSTAFGLWGYWIAIGTDVGKGIRITPSSHSFALGAPIMALAALMYWLGFVLFEGAEAARRICKKIQQRKKGPQK